MSKTIVFKKEFEDKLKKLKIKTKFLNNLTVESVNQNTGNHFQTLEEVVEHLNSKQSYKRFLVGSFIWNTSNEGSEYWHSIYNM
jgi:hypothetical protein